MHRRFNALTLQRTNQRRRRPVLQRSVLRPGALSYGPQDAGQIGTVRLSARGGTDIPPHTVNPKVIRVVRIGGQLITATPSYTLTPNKISLQDSTDYGISPTLRYLTVRVIQARVYLESPPATATQPAIGVVLTDLFSDAVFADRPVAGATCATTGCRFCLAVRQTEFAAGIATAIATVASDGAIPAGTIIQFVLDVTVEFV